MLTFPSNQRPGVDTLGFHFEELILHHRLFYDLFTNFLPFKQTHKPGEVTSECECVMARWTFKHYFNGIDSNQTFQRYVRIRHAQHFCSSYCIEPTTSPHTHTHQTVEQQNSKNFKLIYTIFIISVANWWTRTIIYQTDTHIIPHHLCMYATLKRNINQNCCVCVDVCVVGPVFPLHFCWTKTNHTKIYGETFLCKRIKLEI